MCVCAKKCRCGFVAIGNCTSRSSDQVNLTLLAATATTTTIRPAKKNNHHTTGSALLRDLNRTKALLNAFTCGTCIYMPYIPVQAYTHLSSNWITIYIPIYIHKYF